MINHIINSTLLLLFLLMLSVCLEKRIDPRLKYALWLLAVVKLLIPLPAFETPMSVLNLVDPTALAAEEPQRGEDRWYFLERRFLSGCFFIASLLI